MRIFKISNNLTVVCQWVKTRMAFKHTATLLRGGTEIGTTKICYVNRTWERYEYESVLEQLLEKSVHLSAGEKVAFKKMIEESH
jgi:hypothetical protein